MKRMRGGVLTLSLTLIAIGVSLLGANLGYWNLISVLRWWPAILVLLGAEILIRQALVTHAKQGASPSTVPWDRASVALLIIICLLFAGGYGVAGTLASYGFDPFSVAWDLGWLPSVEVHKTLRTSLDGVSKDIKVLQINANPQKGGTIIVVGEDTLPDNKIEAEVSIIQPGPNEEAATRTADKWNVILTKSGHTAFLVVERPTGVSSKMMGRYEVHVRVPKHVEVKAANTFGGVAIRNVAACSVNNRFGEVSIAGVPGDIFVSNAHAPVTITGSDGNINRKVSPDASADENESGSGATFSVTGRIRVENEFGPVNVLEASGPVSITNKHGDVNVEWETTPVGLNRIENQFGSVSVTLVEPSLRFGALTRFGQITVSEDLEDAIEVRKNDSSPDSARAEGTLGEGLAELDVRNEHGDIRIHIR